MSVRKYAGIGRREVPKFIEHLMYALGYSYAKQGIVLRSGGAAGSDDAFERGALAYCKDNTIAPVSLLEIYLPKEYFNGRSVKLPWCYDYRLTGHNNQPLLDKLVNTYHPAPHRLTSWSRPMMERNCMQMLGGQLDNPSDFVICYTDDGDANTGGTGFAKKVAGHFNIETIDLYYPHNVSKALDFVSRNTPQWLFDKLSYVNGDATSGTAGIIINGVNCQGVMGSGFAKALYEKYPVVKSEYLKLGNGKVGEHKLGFNQLVCVDKSTNTYVLNSHTQFNYGREKLRYADPVSIRMALNDAAKHCIQLGLSNIYTPYIGCGLGGLSWHEDVYPSVIQCAYENPTINIHVVGHQK